MKNPFRVILVAMTLTWLILVPNVGAQGGAAAATLVPIDAQGNPAEADFVRNGIPWHFRGVMGAVAPGTPLRGTTPNLQITLAQPANVSVAYLALQAAHAADLPDYALLGEIGFYYDKGAPDFFRLLAGQTISEWALDDPAVTHFYGKPWHRKISPIVYEYENAPSGAAILAGEKFTGYCYQTQAKLDYSRKLVSIALYLVDSTTLIPLRHVQNIEPTWLTVTIQGITLDLSGKAPAPLEETNYHVYQLLAHSLPDIGESVVYAPGLGPLAMSQDGKWVAYASTSTGKAPIPHCPISI